MPSLSAASSTAIGGLIAVLLAPGARAHGARDAVDSLPLIRSTLDREAGILTIELPGVVVPPHGVVRTPVFRAGIPFPVMVHGFAVEVLGDRGERMPSDRLHHFIVTDPDRRELFAPLALPIFGASRESPSLLFPELLLGIPLPENDRYLAAATLANPEEQPRRLRARMRFRFTRPGKVFPIIRAFPWTMDVKFPLGGEGGRHDFDLPPGRSVHSWEGSPAIGGTIIGIGGHGHDFLTEIDLVDVTAGDTIWRQHPVQDGRRRLSSIPTTMLVRWNGLGVRIDPSHRYRISVQYDNPTGRVLPFGGMGLVAGLVVPDRGGSWPPVDPVDPTYRAQIRNLVNNMAGMTMGHGSHGSP